MPVQILVYDDNSALRESLKALVDDGSGFAISAMFDNADTVESDIAELKPDVILMDIDMPGTNGVEAVKLIRRKYPAIPVIMLTVFDDNGNIFNAICAGASGYILKQHLSNELISAIKNVMSGGAPMTGSVAKKVLQMIPAGGGQDKEQIHLTEREREILKSLVSGFSYKMIAAQLNLTLDGVRFHIKKVYEKLHVHSATEAVSKAIKDKLV